MIFVQIVLGTVIVGIILVLVLPRLRSAGQGWQIPTWWPSTNALWLTFGWAFPIIVVGMLVGGTPWEWSSLWQWNWWWAKVLSPVGILSIVAFTVYGYMTGPSQPFRWTLAMIGIWFFVATSVWYVFGNDRWPAMVATVQGVGTASVTKTPACMEMQVDAPPAGETDEWSEVIQTPGPFTLDPESGSVTLRKSDGTLIKGIKPDAGGKVGRTKTLEFQSETQAVIKVTVCK